uniref:Protein smoothened n=1 Tax=Phallusia mammillata TaxID=59560 RepID=A0A6F9DT90_9ASCI|nr:smoothened protein [Phallusia mammillata]
MTTPSGITNISSTTLGLAKCEKLASLPCESLNSSASCFGTTIPNTATSFELAGDASTLVEAQDRLLLWSGLRAVPRCWDVIQPLLCSVYYPTCENNKITLPDRSLCLETRSPCRIVELEHGWPEFLECDNNDVFNDGCQINRLQFNKSDCELPLIATTNKASYYDGVEGCGLQCMNPLFNQTQHDEIHAFIAGWASVACLCTFFAMLSFFIDWKNSSKYPARIIFYINLCFFLGSIGWLAQFFDDARDEIVCRRDGTMRLGEPVGTGESPSCVIIFVLVYYFLMAGITWFDILSYSWYLLFQSLKEGNHKDPLKDKERKFHLISWSVPFILMLICLAVSEIDGDSMSGICFVGYKHHWYRLGLLLLPVGVVLIIGGFFLCRGLVILFSIRTGHSGLLNDKSLSKITWTMIRIGVFTVLAFIFVFVTFAVHVYDFTNQAAWDRSFREYIKCEANVTVLQQLSGSPPLTCNLKNQPSISVIKLNLIALFGTGIVMSAWVWTRASFANWRRAWFKLIGRSDDEMKRIRHRSRIIAKAFALRNILKKGTSKSTANFDEDSDNGPDIEYSEHTMTHQDPVDMDLDMHSMSQDVSSSWIRNVPKMVVRRGGLLPEERSKLDNQHNVTWQQPKTSQKRGQKKSDNEIEPGLWAVAQYIDGKTLKEVKDEEPEKRKPSYTDKYKDTYIGTSPYRYPINPSATTLSHPCYHDNPAPVHYAPQCTQECNCHATSHHSHLPGTFYYPGGVAEADTMQKPKLKGILRNANRASNDSIPHCQPSKSANFTTSSSKKAKEMFNNPPVQDHNALYYDLVTGVIPANGANNVGYAKVAGAMPANSATNVYDDTVSCATRAQGVTNAYHDKVSGAIRAQGVTNALQETTSGATDFRNDQLTGGIPAEGATNVYNGTVTGATSFSASSLDSDDLRSSTSLNSMDL